MDSYQIIQKLRTLWESVARPTSGDSISKSYPEAPIYIRREGRLYRVVNVQLDTTGKIILDTEK